MPINRFISSWCLTLFILLTAGCHQYEIVKIQVLDGETRAPVGGAEVRSRYMEFADVRGVAERALTQTDSDGLAELRVDVSKESLVVFFHMEPKAGVVQYFGHVTGDEIRDWVRRANASASPIDPLVGIMKRHDDGEN